MTKTRKKGKNLKNERAWLAVVTLSVTCPTKRSTSKGSRGCARSGVGALDAPGSTFTPRLQGALPGL